MKNLTAILLLSALATGAQATEASNGLHLNGFTLNRIVWNLIAWNAITINGAPPEVMAINEVKPDEGSVFHALSMLAVDEL